MYWLYTAGDALSRQEILDQIEQLRSEIHRLVDSNIDALILRMTVGDLSARLQDTGAHVLPLSSAAARCKGTKPVAVILPSGEKVEVSTWKKAAAAILRDCDANPQRHEQLMALRGQVPGNFRQLLAQTPDGMNAPLKINGGLYLESKFDTQALLDNLTQKVLRRVGYDCCGVVVLYRDPKQDSTMVEPEQDEGPVLPAGPIL